MLCACDGSIICDGIYDVDCSILWILGSSISADILLLWSSIWNSEKWSGNCSHGSDETRVGDEEYYSYCHGGSVGNLWSYYCRGDQYRKYVFHLW